MHNRQDRELLELAAKAAGIEYGWQHIFDDYEGSTSESWNWNPLESNENNFELAVKLGIDFRKISLPYYCGFEAYNGVTPAAFERIGDDPLKAARRAIVRAAADLVKLKETSND
jgi:hypothetical protein